MASSYSWLSIINFLTADLPIVYEWCILLVLLLLKDGFTWEARAAAGEVLSYWLPHLYCFSEDPKRLTDRNLEPCRQTSQSSGTD